MAAAMAASKVEAATAPKPQETVFPLPQTSRGSARKPRNIDLMLENLKRWVCHEFCQIAECRGAQCMMVIPIHQTASRQVQRSYPAL
jgi:hypothetical protein